MTKQNTKPEWEKEWAVKLTDLVFEAKRGDVVSTPKLLADLENLLASQRHQLKQQVLEILEESKADERDKADPQFVALLEDRVIRMFDREV